MILFAAYLELKISTLISLTNGQKTATALKLEQTLTSLHSIQFTCDLKLCSPNSLQRSEFGAAVGVAILVMCLIIIVVILIAILCWWRWVREREREREQEPSIKSCTVNIHVLCSSN